MSQVDNAFLLLWTLAFCGCDNRMKYLDRNMNQPLMDVVTAGKIVLAVRWY